MTQSPTPFIAGDLTIDPAARTVTRNGESIELGDLTFDLLIELAQIAPQTVSTQDLANTVWKKAHIGDEVIAQRIALLRKALGDEARQPRYVRTVRHEGYQFIAAIKPYSKPARLKALAFIIVIMALAVLGGVGIWQTFQTSAPQSTELSSPEARLLERARQLSALHQQEETNEAIRIFESLLPANPDSIDIRIGLSFALSTRATKFEAEAEDIERAEALARSVLDQNADQSDAWHALGYSLDAQGRIDEAVTSYRNAFELDPDDTAAMSSAAYLLRIRGELVEALELELRALTRTESSLYGAVQIASTLSLLDPQQAEPWWEEALSSAPRQGVTNDEFIRTLLSRGDALAALEFYNQMESETRALPRIQRLAGRAQLMLGQASQARAHFFAAGFHGRSEHLALATGAEKAMEIQSFLALAESRMLNGDSWPELRVRLAELLAYTGEEEEAVRLLSQAIDLGWRDRGWLEHSPFLTPLHELESWPLLLDRLERTLTVQREQFEASDRVQSALSQ